MAHFARGLPARGRPGRHVAFTVVPKGCPPEAAHSRGVLRWRGALEGCPPEGGPGAGGLPARGRPGTCVAFVVLQRAARPRAAHTRGVLRWHISREGCPPEGGPGGSSRLLWCRKAARQRAAHGAVLQTGCPPEGGPHARSATLARCAGGLPARGQPGRRVAPCFLYVCLFVLCIVLCLYARVVVLFCL